MTGLDTNILLRYFTQDDAVQSVKATHLIEKRLTSQRQGFISLVTLAELVWTLITSYGLSKPEVANILELLLAAPNLVLQNEQEVAVAMSALYEGQAFADTLIAALGTWAGCTSTLTFDRKASRMRGFELIA